jgi:hypothetical protein
MLKPPPKGTVETILQSISIMAKLATIQLAKADVVINQRSVI